MVSTCWNPALLTRMCTVPYFARAALTSALQSSRFAASPLTKWPWMAAATAAPLSLMSATTTCAPSAASRSAMALPRPLAAPVTIAVFPARLYCVTRFSSINHCLPRITDCTSSATERASIFSITRADALRPS